MKAPEALGLHLVNDIVPAAGLWDQVGRRVAALEARSGNAIMVGRQAFYAMGGMTTTSALEYAQAALVVSLRAADEAKAR